MSRWKKKLNNWKKKKQKPKTSLIQEFEDYEKLNKLSSRIGELMDLIDKKTLRWMELDEFV